MKNLKTFESFFSKTYQSGDYVVFQHDNKFYVAEIDYIIGNDVKINDWP